MAKDFFAGLGDDTLPQVPGDTEQVAETDTVDERFCGPALINEAVADLASYRERYSQLAQHVKGGSFHEPGVGKLPADSVHELLRIYGAVFSPQPWHEHVVRFEPDSVGLTLELDTGDAVEALRSAGFYDVTGNGLTAQARVTTCKPPAAISSSSATRAASGSWCSPRRWHTGTTPCTSWVSPTSLNARTG